jgi:hypothetical protein
MSIMRYLNFVYQFQFFAQKGYIPKSIWTANEGYFARTLQSPLFIREWKILAPEYAVNRAFCLYVENAHERQMETRIRQTRSLTSHSTRRLDSIPFIVIFWRLG